MYWKWENSTSKEPNSLKNLPVNQRQSQGKKLIGITVLDKGSGGHILKIVINYYLIWRSYEHQ